MDAQGTGYSAQVRLELHASGERFRVAQFGGDVLRFSKGVVLPGTEGDVVARIDGQEQRWEVSWEAADGPREVVATVLRKG